MVTDPTYCCWRTWIFLVTDSLYQALVNAGYQVTHRLAPEYTWDGTDPALAGFAGVVHLAGFTYFAGLSAAAQESLVTYVNAGGHYVTNMYTQYKVWETKTEPLMTDLALHRWGGGVQAPIIVSIVR